MDILEGKYLIDTNGKTVLAGPLIRRKKYVIYYFSASWCKESEKLLPKLKKIYDLSCQLKIPLEIVNISLDTDEKVMMDYFKEKHGRWYAIPFGDPTIQELQLRFGVTHLPHLIVIRKDGTVITRDGRKEIDEIGINVLVTWTD